MSKCRYDLSEDCNNIDCLTCVLDKIRAEINQYGSIWVQYRITGHTDHDIEQIIEDVLSQAKKQVLAVIDRHIGERSEQNE